MENLLNILDDNLTSTFAKMIFSDVQEYIDNHLEEYEAWKNENK